MTVSPKPQLVETFCSQQLSAKTISCGSHHNAVITREGEVRGSFGRSSNSPFFVFFSQLQHTAKIHY